MAEVNKKTKREDVKVNEKKPMQGEEETAPEHKRPRTFAEGPLEGQLFTWTNWDIGAEQGDAIFRGIRMTQKLVGFPEDDQIESAEWTPSAGWVEFNFKDGSQRKYGLKISLVAMY